MYTDPVIVHNDQPHYRSYVTFVTENKRYRYYNGGAIDFPCYPNKARALTEKLRLLQNLQYAFHKKLEKGWRPKEEILTNPNERIPFSEGIKIICQTIEKEDLSSLYRRDLKAIGVALQTFARNEKINNVPCSSVTPTTLERFLESYKGSAGYYMARRSSLSGLFTRMVRSGMLKENPVWKTTRIKQVVVLNQAFTKTELLKILEYLKKVHPRLYLCALLMYGCFLRPHREVRSLKGYNLSMDCSLITLGGDENKGKRIRIIRIPPYVQEVLRECIEQLPSPNHYVISGRAESFNADYFKTVWGRLKEEMIKKGLISEYNTLYSFRHSGAIELYNKTKDPYKVQQAMGHSSLTVTLTYLRSLGIATIIAEDLPEL